MASNPSSSSSSEDNKIPLLLFGQLSAYIDYVVNHLESKYRMMNISSTLPDVQKAISSTLSPESKATPRPRAIMMGGGFSQSDFDTALSYPGAKSVPWLRPVHTKPNGEGGPVPTSPPTPKEIAERLEKCLSEHGKELESENSGEGDAELVVWYY